MAAATLPCALLLLNKRGSTGVRCFCFAFDSAALVLVQASVGSLWIYSRALLISDEAFAPPCYRSTTTTPGAPLVVPISVQPIQHRTPAMENWSQPMLKAASLLVSATYVHLSLSPPNPPVQKEECYRHKDNVNTLFETFVQYITFCSKVCAGLMFPG